LHYIFRVANAPPGAVPDRARSAARAMLDDPAGGSIRDRYEALRMFVEARTVRAWECAQCGNGMTDRTYRPDARYCSGACRQKAYRTRF
jgi:hypothetical protein